MTDHPAPPAAARGHPADPPPRSPEASRPHPVRAVPAGRGPLPRPAAVGAAAAAGAALLYAFPPYDLWWLAPAGVALLAVAVHRQRVGTAAVLGALTGVVFFTPLLSWSNLEIGNAPWLLLAGSQAVFLALLGAAGGFVSPVVDRWWPVWPVWTMLAWVGQEALRSRVPFGGFPWGRLAFSQADSPVLPLAALGGAPLVSAAVALCGGLAAAAGWRLVVTARTRPRGWRRGAVPAAAALAAAGAVLGLVGPLVPLPAPAGSPVTVAVVQGNVPRLGLDFNAQRRAVLDNHVTATEQLARRVAAGEVPAPDLVVWPENSSDIDPLANPDAAARISAAAAAVDAPILVGAIIREPGAAGPYNSGLVWHPETGPGERYAKRQPVPFAEYLPLRPVVEPVARWLAGPAVDQIAGFVPGERPGVLTVGPAVVGDVICFEVAYDGLVRETVTGGAQLLAVQTNNATFNQAEARQQLAMVRLRAVEHGRESLMASTVGISGFVGADGRVSHATGFFTQDVPVRTLSLADGRTVATTVGVWPELVLVGGALAGLVVAFPVRRRARELANDDDERST